VERLWPVKHSLFETARQTTRPILSLRQISGRRYSVFGVSSPSDRQFSSCLDYFLMQNEYVRHALHPFISSGSNVRPLSRQKECAPNEEAVYCWHNVLRLVSDCSHILLSVLPRDIRGFVWDHLSCKNISLSAELQCRDGRLNDLFTSSFSEPITNPKNLLSTRAQLLRNSK
jgi:hypothetical protein